MTFRKLNPTVNRPGIEVVIGYDAGLKEYRCRLKSDGVPNAGADYFTNDKDDAFATANLMANRAYENLVQSKVEALTNDTLTIASLRGIVVRVWQQIGHDVTQAVNECGEPPIDNETAIESCLDADRPLTFDSREAQALCKLAFEKYGFDTVRLAVSKTLNLV